MIQHTGKKKDAQIADWSWPQVKAALEECGTNLAQLAKANNVDYSLLTKAKYGPLARAEAIIAGALGLSAQQIWPTRYTAAGIPANKQEWRKRFKTTTGAPRGNDQNRQVA